jgi:hypothetical protein
MTLLVAWVGIDTHGVASAYIAADSRISWDKAQFDHGRKVFGLQDSPGMATASFKRGSSGIMLRTSP